MSGSAVVDARTILPRCSCPMASICWRRIWLAGLHLGLLLFVSSHRCTEDVFSVSGSWPLSYSHSHSLTLSLSFTLSLSLSLALVLWLHKHWVLSHSLFHSLFFTLAKLSEGRVHNDWRWVVSLSLSHSCPVLSTTDQQWVLSFSLFQSLSRSLALSLSHSLALDLSPFVSMIRVLRRRMSVEKGPFWGWCEVAVWKEVIVSTNDSVCVRMCSWVCVCVYTNTYLYISHCLI